MNIPSKVKIGFKNYDVNVINDNVVANDKICYGSIEYDKGHIKISNLHSEDTQKCTLIHECLHGIDDVVEAELSEDQVRLIAKGLYAFIKDNPNLFTIDTELI
jgi:hypothetical protein